MSCCFRLESLEQYESLRIYSMGLLGQGLVALGNSGLRDTVDSELGSVLGHPGTSAKGK